jgi:hypothetical protein
MHMRMHTPVMVLCDKLEREAKQRAAEERHFLTQECKRVGLHSNMPFHLLGEALSQTLDTLEDGFGALLEGGTHRGFSFALLGCAVLCRAVLCCAMLGCACCTVLGCAGLCCAMLGCAVLCCAMLGCACCTVLGCAVLYRAVLCCTVLSCAVPWFTVLGCAGLCCDVM